MLEQLFHCVIYLAIVCVVGFFAGRAVPKRWFHGDRFPFHAYRWEREGRVYRKLRVQKWHNKVPDMSKLFQKLMPPKSLKGATEDAQLERMVQETCVAESTHVVVGVCGFYCMRLFSGVGGVIVSLLYFAGNLPFIVIQRYNRPRLMRLRKIQKQKQESV